MAKVYITKSANETQNLAANLAKKLKGGDILALSGDLGGGKTTFVQGLAKGLRIKEKIQSPTFVLMKIYQIPKKKFSLCHIDLYRLKNEKDIESIGFQDYLKSSDYICVIEWAEKLRQLADLSQKAKWIKFEYVDEKTRKIIK
jgi:tRNA threonylcarbamoyladenosine biosynthesis protein TsaE